MDVEDIEEGDELRYRVQKLAIEEMSPSLDSDSTDFSSPETVERGEPVIVLEVYPETNTVIVENGDGNRLIEAVPKHLYKS